MNALFNKLFFNKTFKLNSNLKSYFVVMGVLFFTSSSFAHCPQEFNVGQDTYCMDIEWTQGQRKVRGSYQDTKDISPYLNWQNVRPEKWIHSQAYISVWKNGDKTHAPVFIEDLKVFPYMLMYQGHSHGTGSSFEYDIENGRYILSQVSFQEMKGGCWQLRLSTGSDDEYKVLLNLDNFTNLTLEQNYDQTMMCSLCATESESDPASSSLEHQHH